MSPEGPEQGAMDDTEGLEPLRASTSGPLLRIPANIWGIEGVETIYRAQLDDWGLAGLDSLFH